MESRGLIPYVARCVKKVGQHWARGRMPQQLNVQ